MKKWIVLILLLLTVSPACAQTLTGEAGLWQIDLLPEWSCLGVIPPRQEGEAGSRDPRTGLSIRPPAASTLFSGTATSSAVDVILMDYDVFDAVLTLCHCTEGARQASLEEFILYYPYSDMVWSEDVDGMISEGYRTHPRYMAENPDWISHRNVREMNGIQVSDMTFARRQDAAWLEIMRVIGMPEYTLYITLRTDAAFQEEAMEALETFTGRLTLSDGGNPVMLIP